VAEVLEKETSNVSEATPSRKRKRKAGHCRVCKRPVKGHKNLTDCPRNINNGK